MRAKAKANRWGTKAVKSPVAFVFLAARAMVEGGVNILEDVLGHASLRHIG